MNPLQEPPKGVQPPCTITFAPLMIQQPETLHPAPDRLSDFRPCQSSSQTSAKPATTYNGPWGTLRTLHNVYLHAHINVSMYVHVCMYACMYPCMHACMHACMCAGVCVCVCVYAYVYKHILAHMCTDACVYKCTMHPNTLFENICLSPLEADPLPREPHQGMSTETASRKRKAEAEPAEARGAQYGFIEDIL